MNHAKDTARRTRVAVRAFAALCTAIAVTTGLFANRASADPAFEPGPTARCVAEAEIASPRRKGLAVLDCAGRAAAACMATPGGDSTIGMMHCLDAEWRFWDRRLNLAYAARMQAGLAEDQEMKSIRATTGSIASALRDMQRAWIAFRDAACRYEQAQWLGGTGGGPATLACHLHETARQALKLEGWWAQ